MNNLSNVLFLDVCGYYSENSESKEKDFYLNSLLIIIFGFYTLYSKKEGMWYR
jgi:hypothetical protein